jgi:hypothetical protein
MHCAMQRPAELDSLLLLLLLASLFTAQSSPAQDS